MRRLERGTEFAVHDGVRVHHRITRTRQTFQVVRAGREAKRARVVLAVVTRTAALHDEPLLARSRHHGCVMSSGLATNGSVLSRSAISASPQHDRRMRRQDAAGAVRDQRSARRRTCRSPHSPRNWRTPSTSKKMPYMPGWQYDRPPPDVLSGNDPPAASCRRPQTRAPRPRPQKPRPSRVSSVVIVNES